MRAFPLFVTMPRFSALYPADRMAATVRTRDPAKRIYLKIVKALSIVIPAKAGIQVFRGVLDPGFRRGDDMSQF